MSNLNNNINLILDDKKGNINLISTEKLPNNNNIEFNQQNDFSNFSINDNDKKKNNIISNDLLNTKNEDDLNLSNMNIEQTKKFIENADVLFPDEENESKSQIVNNNISNNNSINNINLNNSKIQDISVITINEEKRIENANNLFGNSLSSSLKSSLNSELSQSLVSEKRKELADELFQTISDTSSKKKSLNETIKSNKSTMSHAINNLSGSNLGLNINEIANKYADRDKIINEYEEESNIINTAENNNDNESINNNIIKTNSIKTSQINDSIKDSIKGSVKESENEYDKNIDEQNDDEISFKNSLIEFKNKFEDSKNKLNNLNDIRISEKKDDNKNDNNLIKSFKKNDLVSNSKEFNNQNNIEDESKTNNIKENNINNISNSELNLSNIDLGNLPKFNNNNKNDKIENENEEKEKKKESIKRSIIDESGNKIKNDNNINIPQKKTLKDLFGKNKNNFRKKEEKKTGIIDREDSEEETSNDILNRVRINTNENNESSILNNQKDPSRISIDEKKNKKLELIKEKEHSILNNMEEIDTNAKLINNNLISGKNVRQGGRSSLLSDNDSSHIKIIKRKKKKKENENKDKEDNKESPISKKMDSNIEDTKRISSDEYNQIVKFDKTNRKNELGFIDFLKENNYINCSQESNSNRNGGTFFEKKNGIQIKAIQENSYFEKYIIGQETVYDLINQNQSKIKYEIPYYYEIMNKTYKDNKDNFNLLFQYITNKDKEKIFKLYKSIKKSSNYYISPYLNDINNFYDNFKINSNNKTFDFIRYTIDEKEEDSFYRCFMFSLFEIYILNKKQDSINTLIFDIFKLYDLYPTIFTSNKNYNINYFLVFFSIFTDYIGLNLWEKAHDFFISFFSQLAQVLVSYMKYNIFLFLSKIYSEYKDNGTKKYLNQYKNIIIHQMEPTCIIFKLIPHIFGINMEIYYYESKTKNNFKEENVSFTCSKLFSKNNVDTIYIIYYNNCYHIGYQKKIFDINKEIYKSIEENLNKKSPIQYTKKEEKYCEECDLNTEYIEINDNNTGICSNCLSSEIDEYLVERVSFINHDYYISDFLNYSYYLRPIELLLKEPISIKNNIENNSIIIRNLDYFLIYNKTFSQRISEILPGVGLKKMMKANKQNDSINEIEGDNDNISNNEGDNCIMCKKSELNPLTITCGCKYCEDCLYELLNTVTEGQIILNGYEEIQLSLNDIDKCPICEKSINLHSIVLLLEEKGRNFEVEYNEAKIRMNNYCKTMCFDCTKKFTNEKSLEVGHNSKKEMLQLNVMINKHCLTDLKRNIGDDLEIVPGLDYSESPHAICYDCYKKNKNVKIKKINEIEYKVITCNICSVRHYFNMKDWDKWNKNEACCKCIIF